MWPTQNTDSKVQARVILFVFFVKEFQFHEVFHYLNLNIGLLKFEIIGT